MSREKEYQRPLLFYGWIVVAISFVTLALIYGARYCFSVFYVAILNEFNWPRGSTSSILSINLLVYAFFAPFAGILMDRYGPRKVFPFGGALVGLGLIACSSANTLWEFFIYFGLIVGVGISLLGTTPHNPILANWFIKRRGLAVGLAFSGVGFSFPLGILVQWFITNFGWRVSYILTGLMVIIIVVPINAIFQRFRPEEKGLLADAEKNLREEDKGKEKKEIMDELIVDKEWVKTEWTLRKAIRTYRFWALFFFDFLGGLSLMTIVTHQVRFAVDVGFSEMVAASAFGLFGIANVVGHASGFISDRLGREETCYIGVGSAIIATIMLLKVDTISELYYLYLYSILFGFGMGLIAATSYTIFADIFYGKHLGSITGFIITSLGMGLSIGPWLAGYIYDITGTYRFAFFIAMISLFISGIWIWIAAPRKIRTVPGRMRK